METIQKESLHLRPITSLKEFEALQDAWNDLLDKSAHTSVFLTWEWTHVWLETFANSGTLYIIMGYKNDQTLVGIAPLMVKKRTVAGLPVRSLEFITSGNETTPDHLGFIVTPEAQDAFFQAVLEYLHEHANDWDMIKLADMTDCAVFVEKLKKEFLKDFHYKLFHKGVCPYIALNESWEKYKKTLSRRVRQNIGKKERRMAKDHAISYETYSDPADLAKAMECLKDLHKKRMDEKSLDGVSLQTHFWDFHQKVAQAFLNKKWLCLCTLSADGNVVAGYYAFKFKDKVFLYQSGIDPRYGQYSVGFLLTAYMIKEAFDQGMKEFDFLRGGEEYKFHWAKQYRTNVELYIWHKSVTSRMTKLLIGFRQLCKQLAGKD